MDRTKPKQWDRLSPEARRKAERNSERKTFGHDSSALAQAMQRAIARQPEVSTKANEARHGPHTTAEHPLVGGEKVHGFDAGTRA